MLEKGVENTVQTLTVAEDGLNSSHGNGDTLEGHSPLASKSAT